MPADRAKRTAIDAFEHFEGFPVERHAEIKAAAAAAMGEVRRPDGSLSMRPELRFTTARTQG